MNIPGEQYLTDHHTVRGVRVIVNIPDGLPVVYSNEIMNGIAAAMISLAKLVENKLPVPPRPRCKHQEADSSPLSRVLDGCWACDVEEMYCVSPKSGPTNATIDRDHSVPLD